MKIYFYSRQSAYCRSGCTWYTCPRRCLARLQQIPVLDEMVVMSGTLNYSPSTSAVPCSGDLILLFAATWHELEELVAMQERFEGLRVILVLGMAGSPEDSKVHQLRPRYISTLDSGNLNMLGEVVTRMVEKRTEAVH